jgi:hypothetical protein
MNENHFSLREHFLFEKISQHNNCNARLSFTL